MRSLRRGFRSRHDPSGPDEYYDVPVNRRRVAPYVDRLLAADALVFSFPVWNMGFPAVLKGFVDKVFLPGVSFEIRENGDYVPRLHNIKRLGVVCTYGGSRLTTFLAGDPPRRFLTRSMRFNCAPGTRVDYLADYDMDHTQRTSRGVPEQSRGDVFDLVSGEGVRISATLTRYPQTARSSSTPARTASIWLASR